MKIKRLVSFLIILVVILTTSIFCFGLKAEDVAVLVDEVYYERIMKEFKEAEKSIYVEMYMVKLEDDGYVHNMAKELIKAHKRGVAVEVVLEDAEWHDMNKIFYDLLYYCQTQS